MSPTPTLSVVICTLNEAEAIGGVLRELVSVLRSLPHEIIVVDDSSDELTAQIVVAFATANPQVKLIRRHGERGLASACIAGWAAASGDVLAVMDGDGQHDPAMLPRLCEALAVANADVAVGSRYLLGESGLRGFRAVLSQLGTALTVAMLGVRLADPLSGVFVIRRGWFEDVRPRLSGVGFKILIDTIASGKKPRVVQLPTALRPRLGGESKLDARVIAELLALLVEKRTAGVVKSRFVLFGLVGLSGVAVNLAVLSLLQSAGPRYFAWSAAVAITAAMVWNFVLNNALTFRDRRLSGARLWRGLAVFCAGCSVGAMLGEATVVFTHAAGAPWFVAGVLGALASAASNFCVGSALTWRRVQIAAAGGAKVASHVALGRANP